MGRRCSPGRFDKIGWCRWPPARHRPWAATRRLVLRFPVTGRGDGEQSVCIIRGAGRQAARSTVRIACMIPRVPSREVYVVARPPGMNLETLLAGRGFPRLPVSLLYVCELMYQQGPGSSQLRRP